MASSPYINHFIQPDTIIPNPTDPQSLNRFAYVQNNPVRFNDPSGHYQQSSDSVGCYNDECPTMDEIDVAFKKGQEKKKTKEEIGENFKNDDPIDPWEKYPYGYCWDFNSLVHCTADGVRLIMGENSVHIDPTEFESMIMYLIADANNRTGWDLFIHANRFDTPFYDESFYGFGRLPGTGCINGHCYARHEINYVAQGVLWARMGVSKETGRFIVQMWKTLPIGHFPQGRASIGTLEMFEYGYKAYMNNNP